MALAPNQTPLYGKKKKIIHKAAFATGKSRNLGGDPLYVAPRKMAGSKLEREG